MKYGKNDADLDCVKAHGSVQEKMKEIDLRKQTEAGLKNDLREKLRTRFKTHRPEGMPSFFKIWCRVWPDRL